MASSRKKCFITHPFVSSRELTTFVREHYFDIVVTGKYIPPSSLVLYGDEMKELDPEIFKTWPMAISKPKTKEESKTNPFMLRLIRIVVRIEAVNPTMPVIRRNSQATEYAQYFIMDREHFRRVAAGREFYAPIVDPLHFDHVRIYDSITAELLDIKKCKGRDPTDREYFDILCKTH
jgi:hypothetical protein